MAIRFMILQLRVIQNKIIIKYITAVIINSEFIFMYNVKVQTDYCLLFYR